MLRKESQCAVKARWDSLLVPTGQLTPIYI